MTLQNDLRSDIKSMVYVHWNCLKSIMFNNCTQHCKYFISYGSLTLNRSQHRWNSIRPATLRKEFNTRSRWLEKNLNFFKGVIGRLEKHILYIMIRIRSHRYYITEDPVTNIKLVISKWVTWSLRHKIATHAAKIQVNNFLICLPI